MSAASFARRPRLVFAVRDLMVLTALIALVAAVARTIPVLGAVLAIVTTLALIRTAGPVGGARAAGRPLSLRRELTLLFESIYVALFLVMIAGCVSVSLGWALILGCGIGSAAGMSPMMPWIAVGSGAAGLYYAQWIGKVFWPIRTESSREGWRP